MNSTPVILHNISGAAVIADVRVPKGTRHISIIPVAPEVLANCALLPPDRHNEIEETLPEFLAEIDAVSLGATIDLARWLDDEDRPPSPRLRVLEMLDHWVTAYDDCPGLRTLLDWIDEAGISRSFDLKHWLSRWQRA
jgi:hypothetical protein